jgi:hypothetical protein
MTRCAIASVQLDRRLFAVEDRATGLQKVALARGTVELARRLPRPSQPR